MIDMKEDIKEYLPSGNLIGAFLECNMLFYKVFRETYLHYL